MTSAPPRRRNVLQFAGASQFYRGESVRLRGARTLNPYMDDAIDNVPYSDNVNIDSYEVIRGPAGVLYANASVGGVVLKATKKPLPYQMGKVSLSVNDWGQYRSEFDFTGPMGEVADAKFSYRLVGAYQDGNAYFKNVDDKRKVFHPPCRLISRNTTFRAAFDYIDLTNIAGAQNFVLPNGTLYTGAGRDEGYYPKGRDGKSQAGARTLRGAASHLGELGGKTKPDPHRLYASGGQRCCRMISIL